MIESFERILVAVPDLDAAVVAYRSLLGCDGLCRDCGDAGKAWHFMLANTTVELRQAPVRQALIAGLVFYAPGVAGAGGAIPNNLGLDLQLSADVDRVVREGSCTSLAVDHVVLRTDDGDACIALFAERLGIRLALDRTVPEWGGRMLFFRAGKLTLEVIASAAEAHSAFWGIAYRCADIESEVARLAHHGVCLSAVREGRKPGTRVATVKSHCLGLPTLLIGPAT